MVYSKVHMGPSEGQMHDLAEGTEVKLSHQHFAGAVEFHLTTAQIRKIEKASAAGKGCVLKLSAAQLRHHAKHGEGVFSDLVRKLYEMAKPHLRKGLHHAVNFMEGRIAAKAGIARPLVSDHIHKGAEWVEKKLAKSMGLQHEGEGFLGDAAKWLGHTAVDGVVGALGGGVRPRAKKHRGKGFLSDALGSIGLGVKPRAGPKRGKGFLGDAGRWLGHTAVDGLVGALGGGVGPNPLANHNETLGAALFQKKVRGGSGLYQ